MTKILPVLEILFLLSMYVEGVYHEWKVQLNTPKRSPWGQKKVTVVERF